MLWGGGLSGSTFHTIISLPNLFSAWKEFKKGKSKKPDVLRFGFALEDNLFSLHEQLKNKTYIPDCYKSFFVCDPKLRHIHKASVRDRVLHQAIFRIFYPIFDKDFIFDSYSSRVGKGIHLGVKRLYIALRKVSANWRKSIFAFKCDIKKFFDSIDHDILLGLIKKKINNQDTFWLIEMIIKSFEKSGGRGLPLGNITSQLFANIYLNELDQFVKHKLKVKYYFRYADDFILVHNNKNFLENVKEKIKLFLSENLKLKLHEDKISIRKLRQGIDFLGFVTLQNAIVLRTKTKRRILKKISEIFTDFKNGNISKTYFNSVLQSYFGVLSHCKSRGIKKQIENLINQKNLTF